MKFLNTITSVALLCLTGAGQALTVSGNIEDSNGEPIPLMNVEVRASYIWGSSLIELVTTDLAGNYSSNQVDSGDYVFICVEWEMPISVSPSERGALTFRLLRAHDSIHTPASAASLRLVRSCAVLAITRRSISRQVVQHARLCHIYWIVVHHASCPEADTASATCTQPCTHY